MQTEREEEALKHQPIAPTPRKGAETLRIHQTLWRSWQTLEPPWSIWSAGGKKAANSFPFSPRPLLRLFLLFPKALGDRGEGSSLVGSRGVKDGGPEAHRPRAAEKPL